MISEDGKLFLRFLKREKIFSTFLRYATNPYITQLNTFKGGIFKGSFVKVLEADDINEYGNPTSYCIMFDRTKEGFTYWFKMCDKWEFFYQINKKRGIINGK
jgi:hypothetical protein